MSRMSQLHAELSQQAYDMGYESLDDALNDGWGVDYDNQKLVKDKESTIQELVKAHAAWEKEKEDILKRLRGMHNALSIEGFREWDNVVSDAIDFINRGEV